MMWPRDDEELAALVEAGHGDDLKKVYFADDLAHGQNILFCATGISDSALLPGVTVRGSTAITHSVLMRAQPDGALHQDLPQLRDQDDPPAQQPARASHRQAGLQRSAAGKLKRRKTLARGG